MHCSGSNQVPLHRCPKAMLDGTEQDTIEAAAQVELGILPDPGGWQDQPHKFVVAWPLAMREIQHWRAIASQPKK